MAHDEAYKYAETEIRKALKSRDTHLTLARRNLTELPESLCELSHLQWLDLSTNNLESVPEFIGKLSQLHSLNIADNRLTRVPDSLGRLSKLETLYLYQNKLQFLPNSLSQLSKLKSLHIWHNPITELPASMEKLRGLLELDISKTRLAALPEWISQLENLQTLGIWGNPTTLLPSSMGRMRQLQEIDLSHNELTELPKFISHLHQLKDLDLAFNDLSSLPDFLDQLKQLENLDLSSNNLSSLPNFLRELKLMKKLDLSSNNLSSLSDVLSQLNQLEKLDLSDNNLSSLPEFLSRFTRLKELNLAANGLSAIPDFFGQLSQLEFLDLSNNDLSTLPDSLSQLKELRHLSLFNNRLKIIPSSFGQLVKLSKLNLDGNPISLEFSAAYAEGLESVQRYLRAQTSDQVALYEAKLILIGEGEVGKSCLLGALRGDPWEPDRPTTHGIEIKPLTWTDPRTGTTITLNGWDFGGQPVYRPTHQLFFSSPAVYLVVWKPREGPQQGLVKEWIKLVKHREPEAKLIVVATHGGPGQRQPDIDRQEIWDLFGRELVVDFLTVESKPDGKNPGKGITELRNAIGQVAMGLPGMGRKVPIRWQEAQQALKRASAAYLSLEQVMSICEKHAMEIEESRDFVRIAHRLGHLIHYEHDPALRTVVILKPDWLSTAMSFVLDDEQTRKSHGLVSLMRLAELWNDPKRDAENRYPAKLHRIFLRLMERFDLSYRISSPAISDSAGTSHDTSLVAQLVPDIRPEQDLEYVWPLEMARGDEQQTQICRIVDAKTGQSATAEGLFYQLIVRLHKFSLGKADYERSVHWQRGLVLDDSYNGRALLEYVGNDVRIRVRAPYPERFLSVLTSEVKWLVENFWAGLRCDAMVPCVDPCGKNVPGTGLFEVQKLIESKKRFRLEYPCPTCNEWQSIDVLLRNAPVAQRMPLETLLASLAGGLSGVRRQLLAQHGETVRRFDLLDIGTQRVLSKIDDAFSGMMQALSDEAKDGPRLFSFRPIDPGFFDRPKWVSAKFRLTLWCEHSRLPLPSINGKDDRRGVYDLSLPREWFVKAAPFFKILTGTLSLMLPVASSATKLLLEDATYKHIEKELELGQKSIDSLIKGADKAEEWLIRKDTPDIEHGEAVSAEGAILRQLHAWLKGIDPSFGGLVRVQNKRQEFLWVHKNFEGEY